MPFKKGKSGNQTGRRHVPVQKESGNAAATGTMTSTIEGHTDVAVLDKMPPVIDKSLLEPVVVKEPPPKVSALPVPGYQVYKCYLGHKTYAEKKTDSVECLNCKAKAMPLARTETCLCSHYLKRHSPHCLDCGVMQGDEGDVPRCSGFNLSA